MSPDDHRHGTYAGYTAHRAQGEPPCPPCREARRRYDRRFKKEQRMGRTRNTPASADLIQGHMRRLLDSGLSAADIARQAGISDNTALKIVRGQRAVRLATAHKLLSVPPQAERDLLRPHLGAARRLQALRAIGHRPTHLADLLGISRTHVANLTMNYHGNHHIGIDLWRRIDAVFRQLSMVPGDSAAQRQRAVVRGWLPPLAWDDIDDPNEQPELTDAPRSKTDLDHAVVERVIRGERLPMTRAERLEVVRRLRDDWGWSEERIETHTGISKSTNRDRYPTRPQEDAA